MAKTIKKSAGKGARKFHYTIFKYLPEIIRDGQINLATAACFKRREHAAWVSTNDFWEESVNKSYLSQGKVHFGNRESTHLVGGGLARIEVNPKAAPFTWGHYVKKSKTPGSFRRAMERLSYETGSNPSEWFASFKPIQEKDWLGIEVFDWDEQCWKPYQPDVEIERGRSPRAEKEMGHCYTDAYDSILNGTLNGNSFESYGLDRSEICLCHGTIESPDDSGQRQGHAWLEYGDTVIDSSLSNRIQFLPIEAYYHLGNVRDVVSYDVHDAVQMSLDHGHEGPWH